MTTRLTHLEWPPTPDNTAAWETACNTDGGDTSPDREHEPEPMSDQDADWRAAREENFQMRQNEWWLQ